MSLENSTKAYVGLNSAVEKLERRNTRYRFDLERDVDWAGLDMAGDYFPSSWLSDLGVNVAVLRAHREAWEMFQWAMGLAAAETLEAEEQSIRHFIAEFIHGQHPTRSSQLLDDEEIKHIEMFQRTSRLLRRRHGAWVDAYERAYAESAELHRDPVRQALKTLGGSASPAELHYLLWAATTFAENVSMYISERIEREPGGINPTWRKLHFCHRMEELQHVRTAVAHVQSLSLEPDERARLSKLLHFHLGGYFRHYFFIDAAQKMVAELCPELPPLRQVLPVSKTPMYLDVLRSPSFRTGRSVIPSFARLSSSLNGDVRASP